MQEGQVVSWQVTVGQQVTTDNVLCEVETEKSIIEIPVPFAGTIQSLAADAGGVVQVGAVLAVIDTGGDLAAPAEPKVDTTAGPGPLPDNSSIKTVSATQKDRVRAMPSVRKIAREHKLDLSAIAGSGRDGRIIKADVLGLIGSQQAASSANVEQITSKTPPVSTEDNESEFEPFTMIRRTIADRLARSWREIPHVFTRIEVDASRLLVVRKALIEDLQQKVPIEAILLRTCLPALKAFPAFNATVVSDGIELHRSVHMGLAADTETGLVVPVLKNADQLSFRDTLSQISDLMARAVERKALPEELSGATFTVNNIGALGNIMGTSIIPYGTTAILSAGRAVEKPVVIDGAMMIRPMMEITLSFDHRAIDGGLAQKFLNKVQAGIEEPTTALI